MVNNQKTELEKAMSNLTEYLSGLLLSCTQIRDSYLCYDLNEPSIYSDILQADKETFFKIKKLLKPAKKRIWSLEDGLGINYDFFYYSFLFVFYFHTSIIGKENPDNLEDFIGQEIVCMRIFFPNRDIQKEFEFVANAIGSNHQKMPTWDIYNIVGLLFEAFLRNKPFKEITQDEIIEGRSLLETLLIVNTMFLNEKINIPSINTLLENNNSVFSHNENIENKPIRYSKKATDALNWLDYKRVPLSDVIKLTNEGADLNVRYSLTGASPLLRAAFFNRVDLVNFFIEHGADCNLQDNEGSTALMIAAMNGSCDVIKSLSKSAVNPDLQDNKGLTAYEYCIDEHTSDILNQFFPFSF
ncbi:MAG: ankyrin repeat domain-containing protein [Alphaproteobacteria bacterium]|nr:ankyrin repeat domain-containing protein [Alphaproteobacteria bacterium]